MGGDWVMRCEARTLDDIRALGGNDIADEHRFAAVDRVSQTNLALYRTFMQPVVRAFVNPRLGGFDAAPSSVAAAVRAVLQRESADGADCGVGRAGSQQSATRSRPTTRSSPCRRMCRGQIVAALDAWRDGSEAFAERLFMTTYGSPTLQAAVGRRSSAMLPLRKAAKSALHQRTHRQADCGAEIANDHPADCARPSSAALLFAGMDRAAVDERGFEAVRRIRQTLSDVPLSTFKATVREQFYMLLLDTEGALAAIPSMLPDDAELGSRAFDLICEVLSARGEYPQAKIHSVFSGSARSFWRR